MRTILLMSILFLSLSATASAQDPLAETKAMIERYQQAQTFCDTLMNAYQNYSHNEFSDLVSDRMFPAKIEFINAIEANLADKTILSLEGTIGNVLPAGDKIEAIMKWDKKYQGLQEKEPVLESGIVMLVLVNEEGSWKLLHVSGESPF